MVDIDVNVDFLNGFYNKLNVDAFQNSTEQLVEKLTTELEEECIVECPVDTGYLRDSHYTVLNGFESSVGNSADYVQYVINGTSKQAPNNFPSRALNKVITETYIRLLFEDYMRYNGIDFE